LRIWLTTQWFYDDSCTFLFCLINLFAVVNECAGNFVCNMLLMCGWICNLSRISSHFHILRIPSALFCAFCWVCVLAGDEFQYCELSFGIWMQLYTNKYVEMQFSTMTKATINTWNIFGTKHTSIRTPDC
jgi:hypothetical protein